MVASFQDQDALSRRGQGGRQGGPADAGPYDDDVRGGHGAIRFSVPGSKATAFSMLMAKSKS
jgi:hypothetical protein